LGQVEQIYLASFPPDEKMPFQTAVDGLAEGWLTVLIAREGERIVGIAMANPLPDVLLWYLSYIAVDGGQQGRGIGSRLFQYLIDFLRRATDTEGLLWEVEPDVPGQPDHTQNRRLRFYERQGAQLLRQIPNYVMPSMIDPDRTVPARLMWCPVRGALREVSLAEAIRWLRVLYASSYAEHGDLCEQIVAGLTRAE
jgi:ribosomal protein S18 acetylase RimI-like enzyme